jgi:hypothetical protein
MNSSRLAASCGVVFAILLASPQVARAQWYFQGYLGGNHTLPADIHIAQPTAGVDLTYSQVSFDAKPLKAPQYYGYRFGKVLKGGRLSLEFEFLHAKVYARTTVPVQTSGHIGATTVADTEPMDVNVQEYAMSHGLNFMLFNVVSRHPIGDGGSAFVVRGGLGPTLPHAESTVFGVNREQYEWAGLGGQIGAGFDVHLVGRLTANIEYKLTYAKPRISIDNGTGQVTALTHQVALGLGVGLGR